MGRKRSQERSQEEFTETAGEMHERLWSWRREEPGASFDEIMERVGQEREAMMKPLMEELVGEAGEVEVDTCCPACGERAQNKGKKKEIQHREGAVEVNREYYYCPSCQQGFFSSLDRRIGLTRSSWSPQMLGMALRQAVELGSYARAAENFSELTQVPMSASTLKRMVQAYGRKVVEADAKEAEAMVRVPEEEEGVSYRRIPEPESEVMAVSAAGVMVHRREEGWKEAKVAGVSAAPVREAGEEAEGELRLTKHSYRAGLWEPKPSPTTTGPRVADAGSKRPNGSSASTMAPSGSG